jgi:hypothetical protein
MFSTASEHCPRSTSGILPKRRNVNRGRFLAWLTAGLLATTTVLAAGAPDAARAQSPEPLPRAFDRLPGPFTTTVRLPARARRSTAPTPADEPGQQPIGPPLPADPEQPDTDPDESEPRRPQPGRRPPRDGDPSWPPQPTQPVDGVLDPVEPEQPVDGVDPTLVDTRSPEELAPFELLPTDPSGESLLVELEPILDRRPAALARFEPFQPVGIRRGGFIVLPEAEISIAALDNVFRSSSNVRRDVLLDVRPTLRLVSNWRRHALEFKATGLTTFHNRFPSEDDRSGGLEIRGRLDLTRRTNFEAFAGYDIAQEQRGSINVASRTGDRADIETRRAGLTFNHRFNRLAIQLRGTLTDLDFSPTTTDTGALARNDERDQRTKEAAARATWTFKPQLAVFGEIAVNVREYGAVAGDGISRDSHGERFRAGLSFGNSSRRLRGEVSAGYGHQQFDDSRLPEIRGIIVDANLAWRVSGLTSVLLTARTDVGESTQAGSGGSLSRTAGLEVRHAFLRRLIGSAGLRLTHQDYEGIDLSEREIAAILGLEYYLNREVTLFTRYQHIDFGSTEQDRNYNADEIRVGMRIRR